MNLAALQTLLDYHYWARDRFLEALTRLSTDAYTTARGSSFASIRDTAVHIYSAEWAWHSRWRGTSPAAPVTADTLPDVGALAAAWRDLEAQVRAFVNELGEEGMSRSFTYRNYAGKEGTSIFWHMAQHVVNHASYHRGQVTTLIRQAGAEPPQSTDLIAYYREQSS